MSIKNHLKDIAVNKEKYLSKETKTEIETNENNNVPDKPNNSDVNNANKKINAEPNVGTNKILGINKYLFIFLLCLTMYLLTNVIVYSITKVINKNKWHNKTWRQKHIKDILIYTTVVIPITLIYSLYSL